MILRWMEIENFRQLHGFSRIEFAPPGQRNVTVFLGENGSGKTNLLHAISWCLHGAEAMRSGAHVLKNPDELLSFRALEQAENGEKLRVGAALEFEHSGCCYQVERYQMLEKVSIGSAASLVGQEEFSVRKKESYGESEWAIEGAPVDTIASVLPLSLLRYFFFAGEAAGAMVDPRYAKDLKAAVADALDLSLLDQGRKHLEVLYKDVTRELNKASTGEGAKLEAEIAARSEELNGVRGELENQESEFEALNESIKKIDNKLDQFNEVKPLQDDRRAKRDREQQLNALRVQLERDLKDRLQNQAWTALLAGESMALKERLDRACKKDQLPSRIKSGFIQELLDNGQCICSSDVTEGTEFNKGILQFLADGSGLDEHEEVLLVLRGRLTEMVRGLPADERKGDHERQGHGVVVDFRKKFERLKLDLDEVLFEQQQVADSLRDIERQLNEKESPDEELSQLLEVNKNLNGKRVRIERNIARSETRLKSVSGELENLEAKRDLAHKSAQQARQLTGQLKIIGHAKNAMDRLHDGWLEIVQEYLHAKIQEVYSDMAILDREVTFDSNFMLSMRERVDGRVIEADPSGANQAVLALSFVACFIELKAQVGANAGRVSGARDKLAQTFQKSRYPMVMDAPFAKMDEHFREKVPPYLANTVPQVVIITSSNQWDGTVASSLGQHVGRSYVLRLHTSAAEDKDVDYLGRKVKYVIRDTAAGINDYSMLGEVN